MNAVIYVASIIGSLAVMAGVYYLIKKYSYVYLIVCSVGAGVVAAKIIIAKDLSILMSLASVVVCGLVAGVLCIPALLMSDIDDLSEEIGGKGENVNGEEKA